MAPSQRTGPCCKRVRKGTGMDAVENTRFAARRARGSTRRFGIIAFSTPFFLVPWSPALEESGRPESKLSAAGDIGHRLWRRQRRRRYGSPSAEPGKRVARTRARFQRVHQPALHHGIVHGPDIPDNDYARLAPAHNDAFAGQEV